MSHSLPHLVAALCARLLSLLHPRADRQAGSIPGCCNHVSGDAHGAGAQVGRERADVVARRGGVTPQGGEGGGELTDNPHAWGGRERGEGAWKERLRLGW